MSTISFVYYGSISHMGSAINLAIVLIRRLRLWDYSVYYFWPITCRLVSYYIIAINNTILRIIRCNNNDKRKSKMYSLYEPICLKFVFMFILLHSQ